MATPKLALIELTHGEYSGEITHNEALGTLDFHGQPIVVSDVVTTQPGSPSEGDAYIIPTGAAGADWAGEDGNIGHYINTAWEIYTPDEGWEVWNLADDSKRRYDGTNWVAYQTMLDTSPASASNVLTLDLETGNSFSVELTENVTTLTISNAPDNVYCELILILTQDGSGPWTFAWGSIEWAGGTAPTVTATINATDIFKLITVDGGTTWYGITQEQNLS